MKKFFALLLAVLMLIVLCSCGQDDVNDVQEEKEDKVIGDLEVDKGITLLLDDGTILHPEDDATILANSTGASVRVDGEPVTELFCDVDGFGTYVENEDNYFECTSDTDGKLYFWTNDSNTHHLNIACGDNTATFTINPDNKPYDAITILSPWDNEPLEHAFHTETQILMPFKVTFNGQETADYIVSVSNGECGSVEKQEDGTFSLSQTQNGHTYLTITCQGLSRTYLWFCYDPQNPQKTYVDGFEPIQTLKAKESAAHRPIGAETAFSDTNGNEITFMYPQDYTAREKNRNQVHIDFNNNVSMLPCEDVYLFDETTNTQLTIENVYVGNTAPSTLLIVPQEELICGHLYYYHIPADSVQMENGTTYGGDIYCQFVYI